MATSEELIAQIERVLAKFPAVAATWHSSNMTSGFRDTAAFAALRTECAALADFIYGTGHLEARAIRSAISHETLYHLNYAKGLLQGAIEVVRNGLLSELRTQVLLDIQADFVEAATQALDNGAKEVAAVLAVTVLEDAAKRLAIKKGLNDAVNKEFSEVVVELFKSEAITKGTKGVLLGYKDLRNSAFHAQWPQVSVEAVRSLLQFLPQFTEQHGV
jgi:hypothetical protein